MAKRTAKKTATAKSRKGGSETKRKRITASDKKEISWKAPFRKKDLAPAIDVYFEIEKIKDANGGLITADDLVKAAETNEVLKQFFTWDDEKCGKMARRAEAMLILRSLTVRYITIERTDLPNASPTRAYEVDRTKWVGNSGSKPYRSVEEIMADPNARAALLTRALSELVAFRHRFHGLQELAVLFRELDDVLENVKP